MTLLVCNWEKLVFVEELESRLLLPVSKNYHRPGPASQGFQNIDESNGSNSLQNCVHLNFQAETSNMKK